MSTIRVDNAAPSAGGTATSLIDGLAKTWGYYEQVGSNSIQDSLNLSSITDNGQGDATLSITSSFAAASYSVSGAVWNTATGGTLELGGDIRGPAGIHVYGQSALSASQIRLKSLVGSNTSNDGDVRDFSGVFFDMRGDLA